MEVLVLRGSTVKYYAGEGIPKIAFTKQEIREVVALLQRGESYLHVARVFQTTKKAIKTVEEYYILTGGTCNNIHSSQPILGSKDSAYYRTEKEMMQEPSYSYKTLSREEKKIYNNLGKHDNRRKNKKLE